MLTLMLSLNGPPAQLSQLVCSADSRPASALASVAGSQEYFFPCRERLGGQLCVYVLCIMVPFKLNLYIETQLKH